MALPLERELQPFQVLDFEPISDYAKNVFRAYREIKAKVCSGKERPVHLDCTVSPCLAYASLEELSRGDQPQAKIGK